MSEKESPEVDVSVDNDILIKAAAFDLAEILVPRRAGILGQARFVVTKRVARLPLCGDSEAAIRRAEELLNRCDAIEPDEAEVALAATLERAAALLDLPLDGGESQLIAVTASRSITEFHTGDKRAVAALEQVTNIVSALTPVLGRVRCLEQLAADASKRLGSDVVGKAVCNEPAVDKTLTICCECHSHDGQRMNLTALHSYIDRLRTVAPRVLAS